MSQRPKVTIYGKPGCHLCEEALDVLLRIQRSVVFELVEVDIRRDPRLFAEYGDDIPVVLVEGEHLSNWHVDEELAKSRICEAAQRMSETAKGYHDDGVKEND